MRDESPPEMCIQVHLLFIITKTVICRRVQSFIMKNRSIFLGLLFIVLTSGAPTHALYLSVVELTHGETSKLTVKVFSNDLQDVIRNHNSAKYVAKPADQFVSANRQLIEDYFSENLKIQINEKKVPIRFEKGVQESDAHFLHFSVNANSEWKNVEVKGAFFTELFPTQSNIFTLIHKEKKFFGRMTKSEPTYSVSLD